METRAHHLLIGGFVLLFLLGIMGFSLWLAKAQVDREVARYNIFFTGSVAGLGVGGDVRFNGIKVGRVSQISINREDTSKVRVTVDVSADTPIRQDSLASLELQGITGISYVQIGAGSASAAFLPARNSSDPDQLPVIQSKTSAIAELFEAAPDLLSRAARVLSDQNIENVGGMIGDIRQVTQAIASRQETLLRAIDGFDRTAADIAIAARAARDLAQKADSLVGEAEKTLAATRGAVDTANTLLAGEGADTLRETRTTMAEFGKTAQKLDGVLTDIGGLVGDMRGVVDENRAPLNAMATDGVGEFRRFISEARILVASLARVAQRLEDDPSAVLFGNRDAEYRGEGGRR
ncbi:MlaD family protein [Ferrovibrio sp.]|uniref:MlaD family protein n=1 Tax=Ferrovibrio sp. TaxID=1917215 RepID=UPI0025C30927|nr:MlaD family protein [Ferrovibrio sp.]MBX3454991.1 MCE family protein [Ferrovibrio sp.]